MLTNLRMDHFQALLGTLGSDDTGLQNCSSIVKYLVFLPFFQIRYLYLTNSTAVKDTYLQIGYFDVFLQNANLI